MAFVAVEIRIVGGGLQVGHSQALGLYRESLLQLACRWHRAPQPEHVRQGALERIAFEHWEHSGPGFFSTSPASKRRNRRSTAG